jgi:phosphohistidine swiveling domain-containing protein
MTVESRARERVPGRFAEREAAAERKFEAPGPGSWQLDAEHNERPHSRWISDLLPRIYTEGFRAGMAHYGALLETIEMKILHGFAYLAMRPVGAPPEARGAPPRPIFWLLTRLHPEMRRRVRRAEEVFRTKVWREDTSKFFEEVMPRFVADYERIQALKLPSLDDEALAAHLEELVHLLGEQFRDHFYRGTAPMLPVGDFIVHCREWTGCTAEEAVELLNGYSPYSVEAVTELDAVAAALRADPVARRMLEQGGGEEVLEALVAHGGEVGAALSRWLERVGQRIVTGHDVAELRGIELPAMLVSSIRAHLAAPQRQELQSRTEAATARLRARVPEPKRAQFDELLGDARLVHPMRDAHSVIDFWALGLSRRALLEAGRRLHERGRLHAADHAVDLTHAEIVSLLRGGAGPSADEVAGHVAWRTSRTVVDAPPFLGSEPGEPPPPEWLPGAAARIARCSNAYIEMMFLDRRKKRTAQVTGTPASAGKHVGTARLVLTAEDFSKVEQGDVLIARITTPAYNVLLPLLGAVVTDRGGLLSHPAIVAREYSIPGVVGTKDATTRIPDGSRVEVDGAAGTVRVLS